MIRINLLGVRKKKKKIGPPPRFLIVLLGVTLASLLVAAFATAYFKAKVSDLRAQTETNKASLATLSQKIAEVKKYETLNKEYQTKNTLIEALRKNQSIPVRILDQVSTTLPEGVWLTSLAYRGNTVILEGYAFTNIDAVAYVENLKKTQGITGVALQETRETQIERVTVYKFSLSFTLGA